MKPFYQLLLAIGLLLLLFVAGFYFGHRNAEKNAPVPQVDTVTVHDTITDYKPIATPIPAGFELVPASLISGYDNIIAAYKDSLQRKPVLVTLHDTTYIAVPMTRTTFTDNKTYKCEVQGYDTKMLWHESYQETKYITKTMEVPTLPKLVISPDFSAFAAGKVFGMGAGVKVDAWAGKWRFSPSIGYALVKDSQAWAHGPAIAFSVNYNFVLK
jgi:hypothetical protein